MSIIRNSRVHESVWEGVKRAIEEREAARAGWLAVASGASSIDARTAAAVSRDLAWAGDTAYEA